MCRFSTLGELRAHRHQSMSSAYRDHKVSMGATDEANRLPSFAKPAVQVSAVMVSGTQTVSMKPAMVTMSIRVWRASAALTAVLTVLST